MDCPKEKTAFACIEFTNGATLTKKTEKAGG